jgi:hypothetical protein
MHITGGGTSASAPVVSGIAALYLEENPGASWLNVKQAITGCAMQDSLMWGPYPNNAWGYGKVNAFESMTTCSMNVRVPSVAAGLLSIFPNPAGSTLHITIDSPAYGRLLVRDLTGRIVLRSFVSKDTDLSIGHLSAGIYSIELQNSDGTTITGKFVKMNQ